MGLDWAGAAGKLPALLKKAAAFSLAAAAAAPQAQQAGPVSQDTGPVSFARFDLADGGQLEFLTLQPAGGNRRALFRAYVLPGSGCNGLGPIAPAYFRGLAGGEVVVPHKRHVRAFRWMGALQDCSTAFTDQDRLSQWALDAGAFVAWHLRSHPPVPGQPVALVGISEGAELLPAVQAGHPELALLAAVGSTGLDPLEALSLQAPLQGAPDFVAELKRRVDDAAVADSAVWAGRSMAYWRDLARWRYSQALLDAQQTLWLGFGGDDRAVPLEGLRRFQSRAQAQGRAVCVAVFQGGDHGLRDPDGGDRPLQRFWSALAQALTGRPPGLDCPPWRNAD